MPAPSPLTPLNPSLFDILTPLHTHLTRLLLSPSPTPTSPSTSDPTAPLNPKDLLGLASTLVGKIQKAKTMVNGLEGVELGVEEQEELIGWLEGEVKRGKGVLGGLRGEGGRG